MIRFSLVLTVCHMPRPALDACMASLLRQSMTDWEAIVVDHGSDPEVAARCDAWYALDVRFHIIHRELATTAHARNLGLDQASGKYVIFLEPDCILADDALEQLDLALRQDHAECCIPGTLLHEQPDAEPRPCPIVSDTYRLLANSDLNDLLLETLSEKRAHFSDFTGRAAGIAIQRAWLQHQAIRWDEQLTIGLDTAFLLHLLSRRPKVAAIGAMVYHAQAVAEAHPYLVEGPAPLIKCICALDTFVQNYAPNYLPLQDAETVRCCHLIAQMFDCYFEHPARQDRSGVRRQHWKSLRTTLRRQTHLAHRPLLRVRRLGRDVFKLYIRLFIWGDYVAVRDAAEAFSR